MKPPKPLRYFLPRKPPPDFRDEQRRTLELQQAHELNSEVETQMLQPGIAKGIPHHQTIRLHSRSVKGRRK
jgi:hypothetical protein